MPVNYASALNELETDNRGPAPFLEPYARISSFLTDESSALTNALKNLEKELWELYKSRKSLTSMSAIAARGAASRITSDKAKIEEKAASSRKEDDPTRHLLSEILGNWESTVGLQVYQMRDGKPLFKPVYMVGTLSSEGFTDQLKKGRQAKDYVGLEHGVFTHRIQWYLAGNNLTLNTSILDLFKETGNQPFLWNAIFDRQQNLCDQNKDYRKPENLTRYILGLNGTCPFLEAIIRRQQNKAETFRDYQQYIKRIIIKKVFGIWYPASVPWASIPENQRITAEKAQSGGGLDQSVLFPTDGATKAALPT
jgi:hypothetical protein